jgi:hypothetical protein
VTGTQTDRHRDTDGQAQGHRRTGTGTQTDRDTERQGQGHKGTGKGTQMDTDTDIGNFNGQLAKNKSVESVKFYKILQNRILSVDALSKPKNKRCSVDQRINGQRTYQRTTEVVPSSAGRDLCHSSGGQLL